MNLEDAAEGVVVFEEGKGVKLGNFADLSLGKLIIAMDADGCDVVVAASIFGTLHHLIQQLLQTAFGLKFKDEVLEFLGVNFAVKAIGAEDHQVICTQLNEGNIYF